MAVLTASVSREPQSPSYCLWRTGFGLTTHQIGGELAVGAAIVRVHVEHIFHKLGIQSRAQLVAWMVEQQIRGSDDASPGQPG